MEYLKDFLKNIRTDYDLDTIDVSTCHADPVIQFAVWMQLAVEKNVQEPNAFNLATVSPEGNPSSRIVLLRNFDQEGFVFFTNYKSHKGQAMESTGKAALNFFWPELHKQVRIEGHVSRIEDWDSDEYFASRPRESQIGAWTSDQSEQLSSRLELEQKFENLTSHFAGQNIPRPKHWGGYRVKPVAFEFWQGRPSRLHDRIRYDLEKSGSWKICRLFP
jgi:pyridoxamine 5'-phosphate oxidase